MLLCKIKVSLQGQFYKQLEHIPVINKFHTHNMNTVKAWFYIPALCSFCDFTNILYGPNQMPIRTIFFLYSWFQAFAVFCMLCVFFWVIPRRLNSDIGELPRRKYATIFSWLYNFPNFTPFLGGPHKKK